MSLARLDDRRSIRPFGDHLDDGLVQLSFSLPVPSGAAAGETAAGLARKMGLERVQVVHQRALDEGVTFFTLFARCRHRVNYEQFAELVPEPRAPTRAEVEARLAALLARLGLDELVVVGAATGTDTHSVGLDAILNMKGYDGEYGLERYRGIRVHNLGSQVANAELLRVARETGALAVLVSQTVTQQDLHRANLAELRAAARRDEALDRVLFVCGGPHLSPDLAQELGYDACFGRGCRPSQVADFLVAALERRCGAGN